MPKATSIREEEIAITHFKNTHLVGFAMPIFANKQVIRPLPSNYPIEKDEPEFITNKRLTHGEYGHETRLAYRSLAIWNGADTSTLIINSQNW